MEYLTGAHSLSSAYSMASKRKVQHELSAIESTRFPLLPSTSGFFGYLIYGLNPSEESTSRRRPVYRTPQGNPYHLCGSIYVQEKVLGRGW